MISFLILSLEDQDLTFHVRAFCFLFVFSWISPRGPVPDRNRETRRAYCVFVITIYHRFSVCPRPDFEIHAVFLAVCIAVPAK